MHYPYAGPDTGIDAPPFSGEVWTLIDAGTFSSGEWLAVQLKDNGLALLVGEPSGGGGDCPGDTLVFASPNLNLAFSVSHKIFRRPDREAVRIPAVVPDFHVAQTLEAYRAGADPVIEWLHSRWREH
ncbi:MAG: S41 family peptidase [Bacillota bacterium]